MGVLPVADFWTSIATETGRWVAGGGAVAAMGAVIAFVYKVGIDRAREWENLYKASSAEIERINKVSSAEIERLRSEPLALFKGYLAEVEKVFTDKIKQLQDEALGLTVRLRQRDSELEELTVSQNQDQLRIDALEEGRKKLEDKLRTYGTVIQQLLDRQETASMVVQLVNSEKLTFADIPILEDTLRLRLSAIDASPMPKGRALAQRSLQQKQTASAKAEREAWANSRAKDEKVAAQVRRLAKPLPDDKPPRRG
jgi:hypothetical protein